ncbi:MAG: LysM peptidoglycan-binding domain-containing protein [Candidatus Hodarchaeales archaeon]|jgi:LysM repeat protein
MEVRYFVILGFSFILALSGCGVSEEEHSKKVAELAAAKEEIAKLKEQIKEKDAQLERIEVELSQIEVRMEEMAQPKEQETKQEKSVLELNKPDTSRAKITIPQYHAVRRGDTLSEIAKEYGMTVEELCRLNKITPSTIIRPGDMLLIRPGS